MHHAGDGNLKSAATFAAPKSSSATEPSRAPTARLVAFHARDSHYLHVVRVRGMSQSLAEHCQMEQQWSDILRGAGLARPVQMCWRDFVGSRKPFSAQLQLQLQEHQRLKIRF